jgi:hypothetical protein
VHSTCCPLRCHTNGTAPAPVRCRPLSHQICKLPRRPEVVVGIWPTAQGAAGALTESETREALERLDPLWEELFPAEQARIMRLLVERVEVSPTGADIRLRLEGLASLMRDLNSNGAECRRAA